MILSLFFCHLDFLKPHLKPNNDLIIKIILGQILPVFLFELIRHYFLLKFK